MKHDISQGPVFSCQLKSNWLFVFCLAIGLCLVGCASRRWGSDKTIPTGPDTAQPSSAPPIAHLEHAPAQASATAAEPAPATQATPVAADPCKTHQENFQDRLLSLQKSEDAAAIQTALTDVLALPNEWKQESNPCNEKVRDAVTLSLKQDVPSSWQTLLLKLANLGKMDASRNHLRELTKNETLLPKRRIAMGANKVSSLYDAVLLEHFSEQGSYAMLKSGPACIVTTSRFKPKGEIKQVFSTFIRKKRKVYVACTLPKAGKDFAKGTELLMRVQEGDTLLVETQVFKVSRLGNKRLLLGRVKLPPNIQQKGIVFLSESLVIREPGKPEVIQPGFGFFWAKSWK